MSTYLCRYTYHFSLEKSLGQVERGEAKLKHLRETLARYGCALDESPCSTGEDSIVDSNHSPYCLIRYDYDAVSHSQCWLAMILQLAGLRPVTNILARLWREASRPTILTQQLFYQMWYDCDERRKRGNEEGCAALNNYALWGRE